MRIIDPFKKLVGESRLEKGLTITAISSFLIFIVIIAIWAVMDMPYTRYTTGILFALTMTLGTLGLRYSLIEKGREAENLAKANHTKLNLSLEEAQKYFTLKYENEIYRDWIKLTVSIVVISVLIYAFWPI